MKNSIQHSASKHLMLLILSILVGGMSLFVSSCSDEEFATSAKDQPAFSTDTLTMGLLLGDNSSKTYLVKLYNRCDGELKLTSISLRNAAQSGFRMNVDGMNGTSFTNSNLLRIAQGDSLFIFVEATLVPTDIRLEQRRDYIDVLCNGVTRSIVIDANCLKVERLKGLVLQRDTTWTSAGLDKQILDSLVIPEGVSLTIQDSVTLFLHDKADIRVRGTLVCEGQPDRPVTLRGDRTDKLFKNLPYDNLPAQWGSLYIDSTAQNCKFEHTHLRGMMHGMVIESAPVRISNCKLGNSNGNLITARMARLDLMNSELSNSGGSLLEIFGGGSRIVHCTLANYNFNSVVYKEAVHLCNMDTAAARPTPMDSCILLNTLIWGRWKETDVRLDYFKVVTGQDAQGKDIVGDSIFSYRFDHCLIRAKGEDDEDFINIQWNQDPNYVLIDSKNYTFDFHVQADSKAKGTGSAEGTRLCPVDLDGKQRNGLPTIGCYESIE